jgi:hypothetical protein
MSSLKLSIDCLVVGNCEIQFTPLLLEAFSGLLERMILEHTNIELNIINDIDFHKHFNCQFNRNLNNLSIVPLEILHNEHRSQIYDFL